MNNVAQKVEKITDELEELHELVSKLYMETEGKLLTSEFEIPFNTFLYKIDWLKDQLKIDFENWLNDCDKIRIGRLLSDL